MTNKANNSITLGLADDHNMFLGGMVKLINSVKDFKVIVEAESGQEFLDKLSIGAHPDIAIIDIRMEGMQGYELAKKMAKFFPSIKVLALSMFKDERAIIRMLRNGARGYLLKGSDPSELTQAIRKTHREGFYTNATVSLALRNKVCGKNDFELKNYEIQFLELCCSDMSYKKIALQMCVSPRTVDGYRDRLCEKLGVKTRVGLALYAVKNGICQLEV
ncbi:MAG: DNA-binding NarL/FixJ family response regulator [Patiriisocius sp.]|jgi:DNA-binding NarL/FixJ family response regulator